MAKAWKRAWSTTAAVTGALLVVAAAPGRAPEADAAPGPSAAPLPEAAVTLLVGRAVEERGTAGSAWCPERAFRAEACGTWHERRILATARGAGALLQDPAATRTDTLPTDPGAPLEIALDHARAGRLTDVSVRDGHGRHLAGTLGPDGDRWHNTEPLRAGEEYTVRVGAQDGNGTPVGVTMALRTAPPAGMDTGPDGGGDDGKAGGVRADAEGAEGAAGAGRDRLTVEFGPRPGTYGAGEIVTASLSHPLPADDLDARADLERALQVTSEPQVEGAWHWVDDSTLHFRPRTYWPAHAVVRVSSGLDGIEIGDRHHGGPSEPLRFTVADRIEAVTDSAAHEMTVRRNGRVIRTIPVTTGKAGFRTRSGVKVILGKEYRVRMRGDTVGIEKGTKEFYDLPVFYATRVTWSGEYVHAAPWSVDAQGEENVSHGCTGMSTRDAAWFYETVREGDIVEVVNSGGAKMPAFDNGFGDWNMDWRTWLSGSALRAGAADAKAPAADAPDIEDTDSSLAAARLRPTT
ncbi:Ig-like domain-containing protein [Streptomyces sp. RerS4]|uniref:L,D-transpeptidase n=1 Tax=Streptomyces sp. RerS4 TaxID=2942449 RepID=UPI00201B9ED8|nr:Ig-like domain-containing protein [Streptomyces sp. RerS4]UQX04388.1 Ig-like domain-containing protein [Streptomyces sp. RerS4]